MACNNISVDRILMYYVVLPVVDPFSEATRTVER